MKNGTSECAPWMGPRLCSDSDGALKIVMRGADKEDKAAA
jgi:hypothetical protein